MDLNKLEKMREKKQRKHLKDSFEISQIIKEIRMKKINWKKKLGIERSLEKFHKPITQEIEKYEKLSKEVVEKTQNPIKNI